MSQAKPTKSSEIRIYLSETNNPWFNLAMEEWIFQEMEPSQQTLFLWRNQNTVVIGRNQNPWSECNLPAMEADGIRLARRTTGGGAVYQDLGNTNFTFLSPQSAYDQNTNNGIILRTLAQFGITAQSSGRNDLVVQLKDGPVKVSGSAFRETRDRSFHHGTLLIDADLAHLARYLTPHPKKMASKGVQSVRARVANLSEFSATISHDLLCEKLIETFSKHYNSSTRVELVSQDRFGDLPALKTSFDRLSSWQWRFGSAPRFTHEMTEYFVWGFVQVFIDSKAGLIDRVQIFSDSLKPDMIDLFAKNLFAKAYSGAGIDQAVLLTASSIPECESELNNLGSWIKAQIEAG